MYLLDGSNVSSSLCLSLKLQFDHPNLLDNLLFNAFKWSLSFDLNRLFSTFPSLNILSFEQLIRCFYQHQDQLFHLLARFWFVYIPEFLAKLSSAYYMYKKI